MATRAKEWEAPGQVIYGLSLGELDFDTPKHICDASVEAMKVGYPHDTTAGGIVELKKTVAEAYGQLSATVRSDLTWPEAGVAELPLRAAGREFTQCQPADRMPELRKSRRVLHMRPPLAHVWCSAT